MGEAKLRRAQGGPGPAQRKRRRQWLLGGAVILLLVAVAALLVWLSTPRVPPADELPQASASFPERLDPYGISVGDPDAPVVVREFADYQCPACARFAEATEKLKAQYIDTGKVRFIYFELPLQQHANAVPAALAGRCARDQRAFWPMHKLLFERQGQWSDLRQPVPRLVAYAEELGLHAGRFERCMESQRHLAAVQRSLRAAQELQVTGTPTVYVDNVELTRPGWPQLVGVVERELNEPADGGQ